MITNTPIPSGDRTKLPKLSYTRNEAAQVLSISPPTLDRLAARGLLNPSRATRRPLYPLAELERFLRETTVRF